MKTAQVRLTAEHVLTGDPVVSAVSEVVPRGVRVVDLGDYVSYKLPSGHWVHADVPAVARDLDVFYEGRSTATPVVFTIDVPDATEAAVAA